MEELFDQVFLELFEVFLYEVKAELEVLASWGHIEINDGFVVHRIQNMLERMLMAIQIEVKLVLNKNG